MLDPLQILLLIYSATLVINLIGGIVLFKLHSHELFKILIAMWGFSLLNFLLQGIFLTPGLGMYISFSTYLFVSFCLYHFSNFILKSKDSFYAVEILCAALFLMGLIVLLITKNYFLGSWFAAIAIAVPMVISSYRLWNSQAGFGPKSLSILLFFNAVHFLDYPILRAHPLGALWGFSIALVLLFGFSAFFPGFILLQISKDYASGLEREVKSRTKELEEAFDQNKTLVNILGHDLSTPLTVLDFYFEEIMTEKASPVHVEYGAKAVRSLQTLFRIVAKVKDLQSITYGKQNVENKKIHLCEVVTEIIRDLENSLALKKLNCNFVNLTNSDVVILGDRDLLKNQILSNLISNAIKFSYPNSRIDIIISENIKYVNVTVEDQGIGIPNDLLPKIFKWSEKTSRHGTNGERGTGLGLPLVKTCVEMMKGSIRVESISKESLDSKTGSKFIIQFDRVA